MTLDPPVNDDWLRGPPKHAAVAAVLLFASLGIGSALHSARAPARPGLVTAARINLNTASAAELEALPRIGPALAERITEDRRRHGPFRTIEDLDRVPGIGPRTIELLRLVAVVDDSPAPGEESP